MNVVVKNKEYEVFAVDLTHEGLGVAKIENFPIFVENLLPEERAIIKVIKVTKSFAIGIVKEWLTLSNERQDIIDRRGTWVGTMPLQHLTYAAQLAFKTQQVKNVMKRLGNLPDVLVYDTIGASETTGYRNKAQIPVRMVNGKLETGFFRKKSHELIPIENFIIQDPKIDDIIVYLRDEMRREQIVPYDEVNHTGDMRHVMVRRGRKSEEIQVVFITRTKKRVSETIVKRLITHFPKVVSVVQNINPLKSNVIMGDEMILLYGKDEMSDMLLGKSYVISSKSFYQVNPMQTEVLYTEAIKAANVTESDIVIDAYCGVGTIGLSFADRVKAVYGVEIVPDAIKMAKLNATRNGVTNANFEVGDAKDVMPKWVSEGIKPNVIIVDPPRKGLDETFIQSAVSVQPERIVYVSCNPATMARDLKLFHALGYAAQYVQPVDLFPYTTHVECVVLLERK